MAGVAKDPAVAAAQTIVGNIMRELRLPATTATARALESQILIAHHEDVDWLSPEQRERARSEAIATIDQLIEQARYTRDADTTLARQQRTILQNRRG